MPSKERSERVRVPSLRQECMPAPRPARLLMKVVPDTLEVSLSSSRPPPASPVTFSSNQLSRIMLVEWDTFMPPASSEATLPMMRLS